MADRKCKGKHLIMECIGAQSGLGCEALERLLREAAKAAEARVLGAHFHPFGQGLGVTGVLILAESHMSVHTWPEYNYAAFDIFMCGDCQPEIAAERIAAYDSRARTSIRVLARGEGRIDDYA
ncbi:MAG: adenosylmethionine decarboxylase [Exilibacterium sp.]